MLKWLIAGGLVWAGRKLWFNSKRENLSGKVALVAGGSRGLGLLLAREFSREGCKIAICARDSAELERAKDELLELGAEVSTFVCDLADQKQAEDLVERVTAYYGRVDILVNVAAIIQVGPVDNMEVEDFKKAHDIIFWGTVYPTLAVLPQMKERSSGRIVNITSIAGKVSVPHLLPYSAGKFASVGFSEGLRSELAGTGITVTTIVPGLMRTGSFLNVEVKGDQKGEYNWFSLSDNLPFLSISAEVAAHEILEATKKGEAELIITVPAQLLALFHGLFPGITSEIAGLVDRFILPKAPPGNGPSVSGREVQTRGLSPFLDFFRKPGFKAAEQLKENPGHS